VVRLVECPGKDYSAALAKDFATASPDREAKFLERLRSGDLQVKAAPMIATSVASVNGNPHVFFANFAGLEGGSNPVQTPQSGVQITLAGASKGRGFFLPFLGDLQPVQGIADGNGITFKLPAIEKGAVFWYEPPQK
jgi:hypothetical protein